MRLIRVHADNVGGHAHYQADHYSVESGALTIWRTEPSHMGKEWPWSKPRQIYTREKLTTFAAGKWSQVAWVEHG